MFVSSLVGQSYKAKSVILAIPPHLAGEHMDPGRGEGGREILPEKMRRGDSVAHFPKLLGTYMYLILKSAIYCNWNLLLGYLLPDQKFDSLHCILRPDP